MSSIEQRNESEQHLLGGGDPEQHNSCTQGCQRVCARRRQESIEQDVAGHPL